ncbi:carnosine synthase 1 [Amia ocellicauda]|uniref:carnosine synthase 1 n=1 Tax=Amia ocellicauda TaxID=2972642 RepID=UPI0034641043
MQGGWPWGQGGLYQLLQEALNELELPPTLTDTPKSALSYSELCICVLGSPLPFLSLLLQAGRRSPGDSLLCLCPSWLSRPSSSSPSHSTPPHDPASPPPLLVHRAVTFDLGGRTHLLTFNPPRRVTYFLPCAPWAEVGTPQQEVTRDLACPMGGSPELYRFWGDTLNCRQILGREGLPTPPTLAVVIREESASEGRDEREERRERGLWVLAVGDVAEEGEEERVREELRHFLNTPTVRATGTVVLKPSGGRWMGMAGASRPIRFLDGQDPEAVWVELRSLLVLLQRQEAALIEAYCPSLNPGPRVPHPASQVHSDCNSSASELSMRVCAIITRSPQNIPLLYKLLCRVGLSELPLSHWDSLPQSLHSSLRDWGLGDRSLVLSLRRLLTHSALRCFHIVMDTEARMSPGQRGGQEAQTDLIGVDMLLSLAWVVQREGGGGCHGSSWNPTVTPVILGLHPWSCLQSCCLGGGAWRRRRRRGGRKEEEEEEEEEGEDEEEGCVGSLLHSPLSRSQRHLLQGRSVLVVGAGRASKAFVWEAAKEFGVEIFLVESDPAHFAAHLVSHFLPLDLSDHRQDTEHCAAVVTWLRGHNLRPQGVLCFWDDCIVLAALLCQALGLPGNPPFAVLTAKEKSRTHLHLQGHHLPRSSPPPSSAPSALYAPPTLSPLSISPSPSLPVATPSLPASVPQSQPAIPRGLQHPLLPLLTPPPCVYAVPCAHIETPDDIIRAVRPVNCSGSYHRHPSNCPGQLSNCPSQSNDCPCQYNNYPSHSNQTNNYISNCPSLASYPSTYSCQTSNYINFSGTSNRLSSQTSISINPSNSSCHSNPIQSSYPGDCITSESIITSHASNYNNPSVRHPTPNPSSLLSATAPTLTPDSTLSYPNNLSPTFTHTDDHPTIPPPSPSTPIPSPHPPSSATRTLNPPTPQIRFPAVLKLEFGAGAVGTRRVGSLEEALAHLAQVRGDLRGEADFPGIGLGWGGGLTLMGYLGGTEHDVDLVLSGGRLEGAFVSDNGPTRVPGFTETAAQMPTGLSWEQEARLVAAAHSCCLGCGLRDGVFNVELKLTPTGPKLIEINARMGGFYLRDWIREVFGEDLLLCAFLCALGIRPRLARPRPPVLCHLTGVMGLLSQHGRHIMSREGMGRLRELHQRGVVRLCELGVDPGGEREGLEGQEGAKKREKEREDREEKSEGLQKGGAWLQQNGEWLQQQDEQQSEEWLQQLEQQKGEELQQQLRQGGVEFQQEGVGLQQEGAGPRGQYEEPFCSVGVRAEGGVESRLGLLTVSRVLGLDTPEYPVEHFLSHFH